VQQNKHCALRCAEPPRQTTNDCKSSMRLMSQEQLDGNQRQECGRDMRTTADIPHSRPRPQSQSRVGSVFADRWHQPIHVIPPGPARRRHGTAPAIKSERTACQVCGSPAMACSHSGSGRRLSKVQESTPRRCRRLPKPKTAQSHPQAFQVLSVPPSASTADAASPRGRNLGACAHS